MGIKPEPGTSLRMSKNVKEEPADFFMRIYFSCLLCKQDEDNVHDIILSVATIPLSNHDNLFSEVQ